MALRRLRGPLLRPICRAQALSSLKPWEALSESERAAWESLGRGESWHRTPQKTLPSWGQLQAHQQAAAKHGLGFHEESWESLRAQIQAEAAPSPSLSSGAPLARDGAGAGAARTGAAGLAGVAWSVCKTLAPIVGDALDGAKHPGLRLLGGAFRYMADVNDTLAAPVTVDDVETIMYLDDSGSMRGSVQGVFGKSGLQLGQDALDQVVPLLQGPTRILKFGTLPKVLLPREELSASQDTAATATLLHSVVAAQWNGTSGGTYMWKMIEEDVRSRYLPGHGRLRLIVITDGEDTHSPGAYCGIKGMDALMKELQKQGFDVEWHIVTGMNNILGFVIDGEPFFLTVTQTLKKNDIVVDSANKASALMYGHKTTVKGNGALSISPTGTLIATDRLKPLCFTAAEMKEFTEEQKNVRLNRLGQLFWTMDSKKNNKFLQPVFIWDVNPNIDEAELGTRRMLAPYSPTESLESGDVNSWLICARDINVKAGEAVQLA